MESFSACEFSLTLLLSVTQEGVLLCWGDNSKGKLGLGPASKSKEKIFEPSHISDPWDPIEKVWVRSHFHRVWMGKRHCAASDKSGGFLSWGENSKGQLGLGDRYQHADQFLSTSSNKMISSFDRSSRSYPVYVQGLRNVKQVSLGLFHSAAIDSRSCLYTWGDTGEGRLGHGEKYKEEKSGNADRILKERRLVDAILEPTSVEFLRAKRINALSVACGDRFTVVVDSDGSVWSWGAGVFGQLGLGSNTLMNIEHPSKINASNFREQYFNQNAGKLGYEMTPMSSFFREDSNDPFPDDDIEPSRAWPGTDGDKASEGTSESTNDAGTSSAFSACGPCHTFFSNGRGKVWSWGKGDHGVLGTGLMQNAFEPVILPTLTGRCVLRLATGDFHSVAVVRESEKAVIDAGYKLQHLSDSHHGHTMLASRPLVPADSLMRFEVRPGEQKPRYGENDLFKNVTGLTADGNAIVHLGGKSEVVITADSLQPNCSLSARTIVKERPHHYGAQVQEIDPVLKMTDREVIEEMEKPNFFTTNPRMAEPASDWKSTWDKYSSAAESIGHKPSSEANAEQNSAVPENVASPQTNERKKSFWNSMAFEDGTLHHEHYLKLMEVKATKELRAHNREVIIDKTVGAPCSAILGTSQRVSILVNQDKPGPGDYTPRLVKAGQTVTQEPLLRPCGIGVTLTSKPNQKDPRISDTVVKEVIPGGAVDMFNQSAVTCLTANDIMVEINGIKILNLFMARKLIMGPPGSKLRILYRHRDSRTAISTYAVMTISRTYCSKDGLSDSSTTFKAGFVRTDNYVGLGLTGTRFQDQPLCDVLTREQRSAILAIVQDIRDKGVTDVDLLKSRHCMVPPLVGIRRTIEEVSVKHPEWKDDICRPGVMLSLFRSEGLMDDDRLNVGPGTYDVPGATLSNTNGSIPWHPARPPKRNLTPAEKIQLASSIRRNTEMQVFGRPLSDTEFDELSGKEKRKFKLAWNKAQQASAEMETPGPGVYDPDKGLSLWDSREGRPPRGPTFGGKGAPHDPAFEGTCGPGPAAYNVRGEGLTASGDFSAHKGCGAHIYRPDVCPERAASPPYFEGELADGQDSLVAASVVNMCFNTPPMITIQGRYPYEPFLGLKKEGSEWLHPSTGPGPNRYSPIRVSEPSAPASSMHARDPLEYEHSIMLKTVFDHEAGRWVQAHPGPTDYCPTTLNNGTQTGPQAARPKIVFDRAHKASGAAEAEQAALPGPGYYDAPSSFGHPLILARNSLSGINSGYIGERSAAVPAAEEVPGPGMYSPERVDCIGSDRVCIGATARARYAVGSTWCARCVRDKVSWADRAAAQRDIEVAAAAPRPRSRRASGSRTGLRRPESSASGAGGLLGSRPRLPLARVQRTHPLSARADMRKGFTVGKARRSLSAREPTTEL